LTFQSFLPAPKLQPYIDKYWLLRGCLPEAEVVTVLPDGCTALCLNLGEDFRSLNFGAQVKHEGIYLIGAAQRLDEQVLQGEVNLLCIQFRPGAFTHFYRVGEMAGFANQVQEFEPGLSPDIRKTIRHFVPYLDRFFLDRLEMPRFSILDVVNGIEQCNGQVRIGELTKRYFITERQLERHFYRHLGISPKEFINLTRFRHTLLTVQSNERGRSLSEVAWDCGYFDHAHLTNDFKRYLGTAPTTLILSDFSKTIALQQG
jgi:AraC-like DNA-binding protein